MPRAIQVYTSRAESEDVFLSLRELFSRCPEAAGAGTEELAEMLGTSRLTTRKKIASSEIETAILALHIDGEVLA